MPRWHRLAPLALLVACTAPPPEADNAPAPVAPPTRTAVEPAPEVRPVEPAPGVERAEPAPEVEPVAPVAPAAPPEPVAAPSDEPLVNWWCVCYSRAAAVEAEPLTACRASEDECHGLEESVVAGERGMHPHSVTRPCMEVKAAHPGDVYGGRGSWTASKKPGAWLSLGPCRLPGAVIPDYGGPNPMPRETFGGLAINMPAAAVIDLLGQPKKRGRFEGSEVSGEDEQTWFYPDQGLEIGMHSLGRKGAQKVGELTLKAPSKRTTTLGVGIGSSRKAVLDAYGKMRDPEDPSGDDDEEFIAGSAYRGIFFTFKNDKVIKIFVGSDVE